MAVIEAAAANRQVQAFRASSWIVKSCVGVGVVGQGAAREGALVVREAGGVLVAFLGVWAS